MHPGEMLKSELIETNGLIVTRFFFGNNFLNCLV